MTPSAICSVHFWDQLQLRLMYHGQTITTIEAIMTTFLIQCRHSEFLLREFYSDIRNPTWQSQLYPRNLVNLVQYWLALPDSPSRNAQTLGEGTRHTVPYRRSSSTCTTNAKTHAVHEKPINSLSKIAGVSKIFAWMFVLCSVGASRRCYLGMSNSHLLLSWAGSGRCDMTPDIGQTQLHLSLLRRESRAAVLPSPLVLLDNFFFFSFLAHSVSQLGRQ